MATRLASSETIQADLRPSQPRPAESRARKALPTRVVRGPNGEKKRVKVIQANSPTLAEDLLAAFRANVRQLRRERAKRQRAAHTTAQP